MSKVIPAAEAKTLEKSEREFFDRKAKTWIAQQESVVRSVGGV
jgi:hypothetical protein